MEKRTFLGLWITLFALAGLASVPTAWASADQAHLFQLERASEDYNYQEFYKSNDKQESRDVNLLNFEQVRKEFPKPSIAYNRDTQFGGWITFAGSRSCLNTRGMVLKRDSSQDITMNEKCTVQSGSWHDPYTDKIYQDASELQIDHVVALKHAYMTGAYEWTQNKRCLYANYMGNKFHLLSVFARENLRKGDRSPREYIPPNSQFTCSYLQMWLKIKYIWELRLTPTEVDTIQQVVAEQKCDMRDFIVPHSEIADQKKYINDNIDLCKNAKLTKF